MIFSYSMWMCCLKTPQSYNFFWICANIFVLLQPKMTYDALISQLKQGSFAPVYLLSGDEPYYIDEACAYFENHILDAAAREFDQTVIYGKDLPAADITPAVAAARGFAMFGGKKVVIVKEAQFVKKWDALALYLDNPQPDTVFVICYKYGSPDKRLNVWKNFEKLGGTMMTSAKVPDYQLERWVRDFLRSKADSLKLQMDDRVPKLLADYIGSDLSGIVGAVDKLINGRPEDCKTIDVALVERNIGISKDYNVFELQDAIIKGDVVKANRITRYFASSKDHPLVKELVILYNFFANLMIYHYLADKSERAAASALGCSPFFVKDYAAAARRFSAGKTFKIIGYFRETDARSKGIDFNDSAKREGELWQDLIYKILH